MRSFRRPAGERPMGLVLPVPAMCRLMQVGLHRKAFSIFIVSRHVFPRTEWTVRFSALHSGTAPFTRMISSK